MRSGRDFGSGRAGRGRSGAPVVGLLLALLSAAPLGAQHSIDQSQPNGPSPFVALNSGWSGQSFVQSGGNISGAGVLLGNPYSTTQGGPVFYELWTGVPGVAETLITSGSTSSFTLAGNTMAWLDFFWTPILLSTDQSLFFTVYGGSVNPLQTRYASANPYASGNAYYRNGTTTTGGSWVNYTSYDLAFRTYTSSGPVSTIPEPMSMALLGTGLAGIAGLVRLRRREEAEV